jgi:hypothetical protein
MSDWVSAMDPFDGIWQCMHPLRPNQSFVDFLLLKIRASTKATWIVRTPCLASLEIPIRSAHADAGGQQMFGCIAEGHRRTSPGWYECTRLCESVQVPSQLSGRQAWIPAARQV